MKKSPKKKKILNFPIKFALDRIQIVLSPFFFSQVKIPCKPNDTLTDAQMTQFLQTLCKTCGSCLNLITLDPGPEQCDDCAAEEAKELEREREEEEQRQRMREVELRQKHLERLKREARKSYSVVLPTIF